MSVLKGHLAIDDSYSYTLYLHQTKSYKIWVLSQEEETLDIIAVNKYLILSGAAQGYGNTAIISRFLTDLPSALKSCNLTYNSSGKCYTSDDGRIRIFMEGNSYTSILYSYGGLSIELSESVPHLPSLPELLPIINSNSEKAIIANLGLKTAVEAKAKFNLSWYSSKQYKAVKTLDEFKSMMKEYLTSVMLAESNHKQVLTGVDTETTGLNVMGLSPGNSRQDNIVAIPFAWEDDKAFVIFTRMEYFSNVPMDYLAPIFNQVFKRNEDFTAPKVSITIDDQTFTFSRDTILTTGHNIIFDTNAFAVDGIDFFFDEDTMQMGFNLATDWSKGRNGLKDWTRRFFKHETLELEDLYGPKHKDKYAFLTDEELALIYGGADADYSRLIWKRLYKLTPKHLYTQYRKYDMCLMHLYAKAEHHGMPIDTEKFREMGIRVKADLETLKTFVYKYAYKAITLQQNTRIMDLTGQSPPVDDVDQEYRFAFVPRELKTLLFNVLGYPVIKRSEKSGEPALDKYVMDKLQQAKLDTPSKALLQDIPAQSGGILIEASKFNSDKYPLARVLATYASLNKEYTAYYVPVLEDNMEDKLFKPFKTTNAATRRIINPLQTIKKDLKEYCIAPPHKFFASWDASQIEYRHMASVAYGRTKALLNDESKFKQSNIYRIVHLMQDPERDYHIETASMVFQKPQHQVSKEERKAAKSVGFGLPYGLGLTSLCETIYKDKSKESIAKTKELLAQYTGNQREIIDMLEDTRDQAFIPTAISDELREVLDAKDTEVSLVKNIAGFYRLFFLRDLTKPVCATLRRKAGNCRIQGGAAELFRRMMYNFHIGCVREGIADKITWLLNVHDELDFLVDDDIDIIKLIEVEYKYCVLHIPDHIPYYIGINFGLNWAEAKDDNSELPIRFVERLIDRYHNEGFRIPADGRQLEHLAKLKHEFLSDRFEEELLLIFPTFKKDFTITLKTFDEKFLNYTVRAYLQNFSSSKDTGEQLLAWAKERYNHTINFTDANPVLNAKDDDLLLDVDMDMEPVLDYFDEGAFFGDDEGDTVSLEDHYFEDTYYTEEDLMVVNTSAKSVSELWTLKTYVPKCLIKIGVQEYSCILDSTAGKSDQDILKYLRAKKQTGEGILTVVGREVKIIQHFPTTSEFIEEFDKWLRE